MKLRSIVISFAFLFGINCFAQYTPLPALDKNKYEAFINHLRTEAKNQDIPELNTVADKMSYDEARRFMANPRVFAEELKTKTDEDYIGQIDKVKFGIIMAVLFSQLTNITSGIDTPMKLGFALGLYSLYTLGKAYLLTELLFNYTILGEKSGSGQVNVSYTYKMGFAMTYFSLLYAFELQSMKLLFGGGLSFGLALCGREIYEYNGNKDKSNFDFGSDDWKRFGAGAHIGAGVLTSAGILIYLSYTFWLSHLHGNWDARMNFFRLAVGLPFSLFRGGEVH